MIHVIVRERDAEAQATEPITSGSVGLAVGFRFSEDWDGMGKAAIFKGSGTAVDMALTGNSCVVPHEVLASAGGHLKIGVYGTKNEGQQVTPTIWADAGQIFEGAAPSEVDPTPATESLVQQILEAAEAAQEAAEDAEEIAQSVRDDADNGVFDGADGYSPSASVSKSGGTVTISITDKDGTTTETVSDGEDATVDATLSNAGEAADAAETGKVKHTADYARLFAETLNSGAKLQLDAPWILGDFANKQYRARTTGPLNAAVDLVLQAESGYRFFIRTYSGGSHTDSSWYGPGIAGRNTYSVTKGTVFNIVVGKDPEDTSITADPDSFGAQITIKNNVGSGGGSSIEPYTSDPAALGTASPGSSDKYARGDHVHAKPTYSKSDVGLGNVDNVQQYSATNPPPYPVSSVNGQTGAVSLSIPSTASDVGAVAVAQGVAHAGEFVVVGSDGNITTVTMSAWQGGSY